MSAYPGTNIDLTYRSLCLCTILCAHVPFTVTVLNTLYMSFQWLGVGSSDDPDYQGLDDPDYHDFRAEASMHYRLRQELYQKAQEAYRRGMKNVASFYSQQGHLHTEKLREANQRAAEKILSHQ